MVNGLVHGDLYGVLVVISWQKLLGVPGHVPVIRFCECL